MFTQNSRNQYDHKDSLELGQNAEDLFARVAADRGWEVTPTSTDENIDEHFDYRIEKDGETYKVEVKSRKRIHRSDENTQSSFVWIELHGVRSSDKGWLYGKADLIAFEMDKSFRIVNRPDLLALVNKRVDFKCRVSSPRESLYKIYSRPGRHDLLTMLRYDDLKGILLSEWGK